MSKKYKSMNDPETVYEAVPGETGEVYKVTSPDRAGEPLIYSKEDFEAIFTEIKEEN